MSFNLAESENATEMKDVVDVDAEVCELTLDELRREFGGAWPPEPGHT